MYKVISGNPLGYRIYFRHIWLANFQKTAPIMATFMAPIMALIMKIFLRFLAAAQSIFL